MKIELETGKIKYLLTNLSIEEITYENINDLYNLRWKIEINYIYLKVQLKIECVTSSKDILIK